MKLCSKLKKVSKYFFISLIIFMIILVGCSVPGSTGGGGSSSGNKEIEETTMSGSFGIKVDPNGKTDSSLFDKKFSIDTKSYTVTTLDITVTYVPTSGVVGTFNWTPAVGAAIYSVDISQYGEYEVKVEQTAVKDDDPSNTITTKDSVIVDIQPMKVVVVTIVPGASLYIVVDDGGSSPIYAVFPEDFDTTALDQVPNGWIADPKVQTYIGVVEINSEAHSSPNCLKLYDANDTDAARAYALIEDSIYGQLSFYFMVPATPTTNSYITIKSIDDWLIDICINDYNQIIEIRKPDEEKVPLMNYELNTWYKVEIKWDKSTGYSKIFLNDVDYGNYQMKNPSQIISHIKFKAGTTGEPSTQATLYVDDVDLTTNPESIN